MDKSLHEFGQEMGHLMPRFMREVFKRFSIDRAGSDITISQMGILNMLKHEGRLKMKDIARYLSITTSAATGLVERMVRSGLLRRVAEEKDRRIINIEMTQKGRKVIDDIEKSRHKMLIELFGRLKPIERERYLKTVKKLYRIMTEGPK